MKDVTLVLRKLLGIAAVLALCVVMLGAYTRLTDAGLGCPDWPGCYGQMIVPDSVPGHGAALPLEPVKAWTEMIHRYAAGTLGILIVIIAAFAIGFRRSDQALPVRLAGALVLLVLLQAALGMWTVTLKLLPVVVMAHLLGGMLIFSTLVSMYMRLSVHPVTVSVLQRRLCMLGLLLLVLQIVLGAWVSANYAGVSCLGFPQCNGEWWPSLHWAKGFYLLSPVGANYQGGVLELAVRITIQFIHRMGAYIVFAYLGVFSVILLWRGATFLLKCFGAAILCLLLIQVILGIINVTYILPLPIAVAHNGVAALLLATLAALYTVCRLERHCDKRA